jgi:ribosome-associated protein
LVLKPTNTKDNARALALQLAHEAFRLKGEDIRALDVSDFLFITDYFVIVTAQSMRQTKALADALQETAKEMTGSKGVVEGKASSSWLLADFGSVVVHVLTEESREFYDLDVLWDDADEIELPSSTSE